MSSLLLVFNLLVSLPYHTSHYLTDSLLHRLRSHNLPVASLLRMLSILSLDNLMILMFILHPILHHLTLQLVLILLIMDYV